MSERENLLRSQLDEARKLDDQMAEKREIMKNEVINKTCLKYKPFTINN